MRRALDALYRATTIVATACLVLIAALTLAQMLSRVFGFLIPSADDFAGFAMAAAMFIGLAPTLRTGGHVRVILVLSRMPPRMRRFAELSSLAIGAALLGMLLYYSSKMAYDAHRFNEFTIGLLPIPKWMPMLTLVVGVAVLLIAFIDDLVRVARGGDPSYGAGEGGAPLDAVPEPLEQR